MSLCLPTKVTVARKYEFNSLPNGVDLKQAFLSYYKDEYGELFEKFINDTKVISYIVSSLIRNGRYILYIYCEYDTNKGNYDENSIEIGDYYNYCLDGNIPRIILYFKEQFSSLGYEFNLIPISNDKSHPYFDTDLSKLKAEITFTKTPVNLIDLDRKTKKIFDQIIVYSESNECNED